MGTIQHIRGFSSQPLFVVLLAATLNWTPTSAAIPEVGRYKVFEAVVENHKAYGNKFKDVELRAHYLAPSGRHVDFIGFFDGDGHGGGNATTGHVWKLRFMPDEPGEWQYRWTWSDGTPGSEGRFQCVTNGAGKGVLQPYKKNPRWFAYNGTEPVWIKSYYETGHGSIAQPFDWIAANVYQPLLDRGYNHLQVNWLLSLCCFEQYYKDGPPPSSTDLTLYEEGNPSSSMRLDVWQMMERPLAWLNDRNVGVHLFLGFEGRKNDGPSWNAMSDAEKDFLVRYVVARVAPFANIAGWNFVWEDPGHRETHELGLARLLEKHDIFNHLRTYQDEHPRDNEYQRPEYTFAAIENHRIAAPEKPVDMLYWKSPWTHHQAALLAYVEGKPIYMSEGNALWRRYWSEKAGATQDDLRQAAWAVTTAGASFCWNGHAREYELYVRGPEGMPFHGKDNPYTESARYIDIVAEVMTEEVAFHRMSPSDFLLTDRDPLRVWCLAEPGQQYLVFATAGEAFTLHLTPGNYSDNVWVNTKTGAQRRARAVQVNGTDISTERSPILPDERRIGTKAVSFAPPNHRTDWVLLVRSSQ